MSIKSCFKAEREIEMNRIASYHVELVRERSNLYESNKVNGPDIAAEILYKYLKGTDRENFVILLVDTKNHVVGINTVSVGSLSGSVVTPREAFKTAILGNAAAIIVGHNHPSGETSPSREDIAVTERLVKAGKVMDIPVLDHIIIGDTSRTFGSYTSFKERGLL